MTAVDDGSTADGGPATTEGTVESTTDADDGTGSATGLDSNLAGALSYLLGPVTGILFYVLEDEDEFVRFHAAQSTVVFGGLFVLTIVLSVVLTLLAAIPVVGWIIGLVLGFGALLISPLFVLVWLFLMYKAFSGDRYVAPIAGKHAEKYAAAN